MSYITQYHWFSCNFFGSAGIQTQKCGFQPKITENVYLCNQTSCENGQYHFLAFVCLFFGKYTFECILRHLNPFLAVSATVSILVSFSYHPKSFIPVLSQLLKTLRLFLPFLGKKIIFSRLAGHILDNFGTKIRASVPHDMKPC